MTAADPDARKFLHIKTHACCLWPYLPLKKRDDPERLDLAAKRPERLIFDGIGRQLQAKVRRLVV